MKRALVGMMLALLAACTKGGDPTGPVTEGTLSFQIERRTCSAEAPFEIELFIDHVLVRTATFTVDSTASFTVTAGSHVAGAIATNRKYSWAFVTIEVPAGGRYTAHFACQ